MSDKFKTIVYKSDGTLSSSDLSAYKGFFYQIFGDGGDAQTTLDNNVIWGGSSGYVSAGYIDLEYPYIIDSVDIKFTTDNLGYAYNTSIRNTQLKINYKSGSIRPDPTNGSDPLIIRATKGYKQTYTNDSNKFIYGRDIPGINSLNPNVKIFDQSNNQYSTTGYVFANTYYYTNKLVPKNLIGYSGLISSSGPSRYCLAGGSSYGGGIGSSQVIAPGAGATGPYGYGTGGFLKYTYSGGIQNVITSNSDPGYAVITLIPYSCFQSRNFYNNVNGTSESNNTPGIILTSLLAGGGSGGYNYYSGTYNYGGGGGGSGSYQLCLKNYQSYNINVYPGKGGPADTSQMNANKVPGINGDKSYITGLDIIPTTVGGQGGFCPDGDNGSGGLGYYTGGAGMGGPNDDIPGPIGTSYINIPTYTSDQNFRTNQTNERAGNGAGFVNFNYGQGGWGKGDIYTAGGGGGGGPYGGNGASRDTSGHEADATPAQGYGCGGGGGFYWYKPIESARWYASAGSGGYAIVNTLVPSPGSNYIVISVGASNTSVSLSLAQLAPYTGVWYFLNGDTYLPEVNIGHFLIKEDGVASLSLNYSSSTGGSITFNFNTIYLTSDSSTHLQNVTYSASKGNLPGTIAVPSFASILLYK